jgi:hypothetical protein
MQVYGMMLKMKINRSLAKRLIVSLLALAVFLSLYVFFLAKKQTIVYFEGINATSIPYEDLISKMDATPKAYFFCTESDIDCRYIDTEMLDILIVDAHAERFNNLLLVDTASLDVSILPSALKDRFGFSDYPAFAILSYENGTVIVHSVLQWTNEDPFTMLDLKEWMKENKLWLKEYTN